MTDVLQLYRPGDWYSVWRFFERGTFLNGYVNFEMPIIRRADGFDTADYCLDIVIASDGGSWEWKDVDDLDAMLAEGRVTTDEADGVRRAARTVADDLNHGRRWWSGWDGWYPPAEGVKPSGGATDRG